MFSLPGMQKLMVLAALIMAVWFGFKLIGYFDRMRKEQARLDGKVKRNGRGKAAAGDVEDLVKCAACGDFVPARRPSACGRGDCPY